ncbi:Endo-1,4-beta-xylanase A [Hypsizygus marmoreus]|uniref:Beta-xylanase n=1 Tax=Hypsizygus marmoreus TaxID=39966 RepID=A0A369JZZ9_HYPMA|nr:Endo-1,4-beta-xylanase A [Hypsizygus marmoreus]
MMKRSALLVAVLSLIPLATAQSGAWGQCGGSNWTGPATCIAGYTCTYSNPYYSQCLPNETGTTATSTGTSALPSGTSTAGLAVVAKAAGKEYFGSATDNSELTDTAYVDLLSNTKEFNQLTPGNSMKWDATEGTQGTFTFTKADQIVTLAQQNGQLIRGHTCVWHSQLPSWVTAGNFDASTLTSIIQTHTTNVVGHFKGKITMTSPLQTVGMLSMVGHQWTIDHHSPTRVSDPLSSPLPFKLPVPQILQQNSTSTTITSMAVGTGAKSTAMVNLVKSLKASGVPIDGVGIQAHLIVGQVPSTIQANIAQFAALGVEVAITELDIRMTLPATAALLEKQKKDYQTVIAACKAVSDCIGVTIWDYTDKYSWVPSVFPGQGAPLPWDANLVKKPAYDGIVVGFTL